MPPSTRPQTLKQAKRAYRKSGASVRLSASELAQAERRASLQERADRIKEREAKRKSNLKKREEKIAKEREMARKMGRPFAEDQKTGWTVGPNQLSLGGFLGGVKKMHQNQELLKNIQAEEEEKNSKYMSEQGQDHTGESLRSMAPYTEPPAQPTVNEFVSSLPNGRSPSGSVIQMPPPKLPSKQVEVFDEDIEECFPSNTQIQRELLPEDPQNRLLVPSATSDKLTVSSVRAPTCYRDTDAIDLLAGISTQDLDFSGPLTQVALPAVASEEPDLLAQISTQDLDFEEEFQNAVARGESVDRTLLVAQISTQDLDFSQGSADTWNDAKVSESEFADTPTDNDLEDLAMEIEKGGSANVVVR